MRTPRAMDPSAAVSPALADALGRLAAEGGVRLAGAVSEPYRRWTARLRRAIVVSVSIGALGVVALLAGLALRDVGAWGVLVAVGPFIAVMCLAVAGVVAIVAASRRPRIAAEYLPVVIGPQGIALRGIGPVPWGDVLPPEHRSIAVKNDAGGRCAVMPLTPAGLARVETAPPSLLPLIGPRPYLRSRVPFLLLPGIEGLTEDETVRLFRAAHDRYAGRAG